MSKTIYIRLKKAGAENFTFSIYDDRNNLLLENVSKKKMVSGFSISVDDIVKNLQILYFCKNSCVKTKKVRLSTISTVEISEIKYIESNTASTWSHLTDPTLYNNFYGCIHPYIIEYPFAYEKHDQILQSVKEYTKAFIYLPGEIREFDENRKVQVDNKYFNKAILYNDQQSSGILELVVKPSNNMKSYLEYPKYNTNSKTILYTKSDNIYHYNTFWSVVKNPSIPLFLSTCESMSIDKQVNQENMDYSQRHYKKDPLRAKDLKVRHILDNDSNLHLVNHFIITPSQISYN
jgi:hypothetical protein